MLPTVLPIWHLIKFDLIKVLWRNCFFFSKVFIKMAQYYNIIWRDLLILANHIDANSVSQDYILYHVEWLLERLGQVSAVTGDDIDPVILANLEESLHRLRVWQYDVVGYRCENALGVMKNGEPGCPYLDISVSAIEYYIQSGVTASDFSNLMSVSERTIQRRMEENTMR